MGSENQGSVFDGLVLTSSIAEEAMKGVEKRKRARTTKILAVIAACAVALFIASSAMTDATLPQMMAGKRLVYADTGKTAYYISADGREAYWADENGQRESWCWGVKYGGLFGAWNRQMILYSNNTDFYDPYIIEETDNGTIVLTPVNKTGTNRYGEQFERSGLIAR